ncbi:methyltransferase domain-containing protein [Inquilinus sp. KBS0705]|nr:methyltransferase domain-containing protein [Inquilinus sp. KBS0705]
MSYKCELCDSEKKSVLYSKDRNGKDVNNFICGECGFVFVLPRPSEEVKVELYKEGLFSLEGRGSLAPDDAKFKKTEALAYKRFKLLESVIGEDVFSKNKKTVEIGCGAGSFLRYMSAAGWEVTGIEPDPVFALAGKERYGINIESTFLEEFDPGYKFDLISTFHVIEHVEEVNAFLSKINLLLNDNGILFIECPTIDKMYGPNADFFFWDVHINTFSNLTLKSFLIKHGFEIVEQTVFGNFINYICRKNPSSNDYTKYFDRPARIEELVEKKNKGEKPTLRQILGKAKLNLKKKIKSALKSSKQRIDKNKIQIAHIGFHNAGNTGDVVLFESVRLLFKSIKKDIQFSLFNVHDQVTPELIKTLNKFDLIIIGGGGLFLRDTNPNEISGWQWACPNDLMEKITTPIAVFAVGYNRFRNQEDFHENFRKSIAILMDKSVSFGIRNTGSINKLKDYYTPERQKQIIYQPCSTTFLDKYFESVEHISESNKIAVNIAFDRHSMRFQGKEKQVLYNVADALKYFSDKGWQIDVISHVPTDQEAQIWFKARGLNFNIVNIEKQHVGKVADVYKQYKVVLGMRGHAQMIPFGLSVPIITLSTHDKMMYFLEDIQHTEWGIELVKENNLKEEIINKVNYINDNYPLVKKQIAEAQEKLWQSSKNNIENIFSRLKNKT